MFKKKQRFVEKAPLRLNSNNHYYSLIPADALYRDQLDNLKKPEFNTAVSRITRDLNLLFYMNDK